MKHHIDTIKCPECGQEQNAKVLHTFPFNSYVHECIKCGYVVMESEWAHIDKEINNK